VYAIGIMVMPEHLMGSVDNSRHQRDALSVAPSNHALTPTQFRVLQGVHLGLANKQIAFRLGIAEATVKAHMTALMRKLNVRNRTQVAILAEKIATSDVQIYEGQAQTSFAHHGPIGA
jgi:DNA-binding NarL/FixJ family response regulator